MDERERRRHFEALMQPHLEWLYRLAYRYTGHREDAEDLLQELMLRLYRQPGALPQVESPKPWLVKALHNLFIDQWRHRRRTPQAYLHPDPWESLFAEQAGGDTPENALQQSGLQREVLKALYSLDTDHRAVLVLHDMEGHTLPELADTLALPIGTLKSRLFRARRKLRLALESGNLLSPGDVMLTEV